MKSTKLGDSYDIVKRTLLRSMRRFGAWSVHPMFTDVVSVQEYEKLIGARVISTDLLDGDGRAFLERARLCRGNLFLDPDTGLSRARTNSVARLSIDEFCEVATRHRGAFFTAIFDQGFSRWASDDVRKEAMRNKLGTLGANGIHGFAYFSHACFIVAGTDKKRLATVRSHVVRDTGLPQSRFLP